MQRRRIATLAASLVALPLALGAPDPASPQATPVPTASPTPVASPNATATPTYRFVYKPTPAPAGVTTPFPLPGAPQILEIDLGDSTLVTPGTLRVRVLTSESVASIAAETFGYSVAIPKKGSGLFSFEGDVGDVPAFVKNRTYDVVFTATGSDGRTATVALPLTLR